MSKFVQISPRVLQPRLPELGQIKIGGKGEERESRRGKKFRLPVKYDHFVITTRVRDGRTENMQRDERIHSKIGDKPVELDVRLLWDDPAANWQAFLAGYDGQRRRCIGNGETAEDAVDGTIPCTCPLFRHHKGSYSGPRRPIGQVECKPHGRLSVILEEAEAFGGYYVFRTTSIETISNISSQLELFRNQFGFLAGLPLKMRVYPATDRYEEDGETRTSTSYKVSLEVRASFDVARQLAAAAYDRRSSLALPSPSQASLHREQMEEAEERDAADIAEEFHPNGEDSVDAEIVRTAEDDELDQLEEVCRYTLDLAGWPSEKINRQMAKRSDDIRGLAQELERAFPLEWSRAMEEIVIAAEDAEVGAVAPAAELDHSPEAPSSVSHELELRPAPSAAVVSTLADVEDLL